MKAVQCTDDIGFDRKKEPCTRVAVVRVTVTGAQLLDITDAPRCRECARIAERIVAKFYPAGTYTERPIADPTVAPIVDPIAGDGR